jgi:hypothetical protein
MEYRVNNDDYKKADLGYLYVKIRGVEYRVEDCNGELRVTKLSDSSECVLELKMTQYTNSILIK